MDANVQGLHGETGDDAALNFIILFCAMMIDDDVIREGGPVELGEAKGVVQ